MSAFSIAVLVVSVIAQADPPQRDPQPTHEQKESQRSLEMIKRDVDEYEFQLGVDDARPLARSSDAVLRWSNPVRGVDDAVVFVWLDRERPQIIGTVMSFRGSARELRRSYEFVSLSEDRLVGQWKGERAWHPSQGGVVWKLLPDAPTPAATAAARLQQMRNLVASFSVSIVSRDKSRYELRLLRQPIYRYSGAQRDVLDGGLFAFAEGTDPELLVLLEARKNDDASQWHYALARMCAYSIEIRLRDSLMHEFPAIPFGPNPTGTYTNPEGGIIEAPVHPKSDDGRQVQKTKP